MNLLPRVWATLAVTGSIVLAVLSRPAILRMGHDRPRFLYVCTPLPTPAYDALAARPGWTKTALEVAPGVSLNGLLRRPQQERDARWVVFFPGNDVSQLTAGQALLDGTHPLETGDV